MSLHSAKKHSEEQVRLTHDLERRYLDRAKEREPKLKRVEEAGVFAAAGADSAIRRTAHMSHAEGRALIAPAPIAARPATGNGAARSERLSKATERTLEAVIGGFDDSDHINFLARGMRAARAVCRLVQDGQAVGTGFLVAPGVILTNNHVIASKAEASAFVAEFDYELDVEDQPRRPVVRFRLDPERAFVTSSSREGLDFTFVAVAHTSIDRTEQILTFGWLPMDERRDKILEGEPAVIIQHPRGDPKRLCLFAAELVDRPEDYIHYTTDTDGGASGSPVLNRGWLLIGLHHAATTTDKKRRGHPIVVNEGIRVSSMIQALRTGERILEGDGATILSIVTSPEVVADGRPQSPILPALAAPTNLRGEALVKSLSPDSNGVASLWRPHSVFERTSIRRRDRDHFEARSSTHQGYKTRFLGNGAEVALPRLPDGMLDDAARLNGGNSFELTYTHYSTVHSVSRRLPFLTAVNIDGAKLKKRGREDRDFEAADKWYFDPRIAEEVQLGPEVYDGTPFDFGHMVRREDPVWGDDRTATMANDDTFYMTNCAPQHSDLNQKTWLSLENAALEAARTSRTKISVFTGPILSPQDPSVRGVQVPTAFWKIVAYRAGGRLRAHGFMQWQTELVDDVRSRFEGLDRLERAVEYQVPIRDIARDSALDFGALVAADQDLVADPGHESTRPRQHRLTARIVESLSERIAAADASDGAESGFGNHDDPEQMPFGDRRRFGALMDPSSSDEVERVLGKFGERFLEVMVDALRELERERSAH
jgi:endonuclease G